MKKIISMFLCLCMLMTVFTGFAADTDTTDVKVCKVLLDENFEGENFSIKMEESSGAVATVNNVETTDKYGQANKKFSVTNANTSPYGKIVFDEVNPMTESMRAGAHNETSATYGYTVELSADWNPFDYNTTNAKSYLAIRGREKKETDFQLGQFMYLLYQGGDAETSVRTISVCDRSMAVVETFDLTEVIGDEVWDTEHIYRIRFVMKPYTEVRTVEQVVDGETKTLKYSGVIDIYIDGVKLSTFEYKDDTRETYVYGLFYRANKVYAGSLDNIKMVSYWDALTSDTDDVATYINDDKLVSAIRRCEAELSGIENDQAEFSNAISAAKSAFEATDRTQATIDEALKTLEAAEKEATKVYKYKTLYKEDFEGSDCCEFNAFSADETNEGGIAAIDTINSCYGTDEKWYSLQASGKYGVYQQFSAPSQKIQGNATNIANNYKVELSFDYKMPEGIISYILINANNGSGEFQKGGKIFQLNMNPNKGTAVLNNRSDTTVAEFNLADYAKGAIFAETVNRFRFVFEPETIEEIDGVKYAGTLNLYINGIKVCDAKYVSNAKESGI